jgi:hypothetical protein
VDLADEIAVTDVDINGFLQENPDIRYFRTSACTGSGVREVVAALLMGLPKPVQPEVTMLPNNQRNWLCC